MKKWDYIIIALLSVVAFVWLGVVVFNRHEGDKVVVTVDGAIVYTCSLDEDVNKVIKYGDDYNQLVVKDGEASIISANCPGGDCVRCASISKDGESIICIPHGLVVTVESEEQSGVDFISK